MSKRRLPDNDQRRLRTALVATRGAEACLTVRDVLSRIESEKDLTRDDLRSALHGPFRDNCIEISLALGDGEVYKLRMWKPHKQVEHLLAQNPDFEDLIDETLRLHPPTMRNPWRILVGWDEMVPGNPLSETDGSSWSYPGPSVSCRMGLATLPLG